MRVEWSSCKWQVQGELIERSAGSGIYLGSVIVNNSVHGVVVSDSGGIFDVPVRYIRTSNINKNPALDELAKESEKLNLYEVHNAALDDNNPESSQSQGPQAGKVHKG